MAKAKAKEIKKKKALSKPRVALPSEFEKKVGLRLKALRKAKGYGPDAFAIKVGITNRSQYFYYEQGRNITLATLNKLCTHLGITIQEFFAEGF